MTAKQKVTVVLSLLITAIGARGLNAENAMAKQYCTGPTHFCVQTCGQDPVAFCSSVCYGVVHGASCTYISSLCDPEYGLGVAYICTAEGA